MDYFTSDFHLGHSRTISAFKRPFTSVEEMNKAIVENVLSTLKKNDNLYFLGDLGFNEESMLNALMEFKKKKINFFWILGNHDKSFKLDNFIPFCHTITDTLTIKRNHTIIHMNHFPMLTWEKSFYNSFHLYGHLHKSSVELEEIEKRQTGKAFNVNLEFNNYRPYSLDDIFYIMSQKGDNWDYELLKKERGDDFLSKARKE